VIEEGLVGLPFKLLRLDQLAKRTAENFVEYCSVVPAEPFSFTVDKD
jgi:hypothetical protein